MDGIFALMKEMGIWEGETAKPKEPIVSRDGEVGFVSAGRPGIFAPCVRHWINVEKGELIGRILNPLEGTVEEMCIRDSSGPDPEPQPVAAYAGPGDHPRGQQRQDPEEF